MEIIELIAEGDAVAAHFTCSATHTGTWLGHPPTGRRFERIDEVGIYRPPRRCWCPAHADD